MRGACSSGALSAKAVVRLSDRCVEPCVPEASRANFSSAFLTDVSSFSAPGPFQPSFLSAYLTDAWTLLLRCVAKGSARLSGRCVEPSVPEPFRPRFSSAFLGDSWSLVLRSSFGQGFCPLIGPTRGALCSGAISAKLVARLTDRFVEPCAPEPSRPRFSSAFPTNAWSFSLRSFIG